MGTLLGAIAPGSALASEPFDAIVAEAVTARNAGDLERTATLLQQAYRLRPAPELMNNLGKIYEGLGRYAEAVDAYSLVIATPGASQELKDLDRRRIAALEPKLSSAWIEVTESARKTLVWVNGDPVRWTDDPEVAVAHGAVVVETSAADGASVRLHFTRFSKGRLHRLVPDTTKGWGAITLRTLDPRPESLEVNGYTVQTPMPGVATIHLQAGRYGVEVGLLGHMPVIVSIAVATDDAIDLAPLMEAKKPRPEIVGTVARTDSSLMGPTLTAGAGLIAASVGAFLVQGANSDRQEVRTSWTRARPVSPSPT